MVLIGVGPEDTKEIADFLVQKLINLRVFEDENEKMNLSIKDIDGELLLISQFTLYADTSHGNRPSFIKSAKPDISEPLYNYAVKILSEHVPVKTGVFRTEMQIDMVADGPCTILLDSEKTL